MKVNFRQRSSKKELLDREDIPFDDIRQNMKELDVINTRLGGHRITLKGIKKLLLENATSYNTPVHIVELGCGGGDNLRVIKNWAENHHVSLTFTGVDINEACIAYAKSLQSNNGIDFICADYRKAAFKQKPSIIFSSLFCHHFKDDELVWMLQWLQQNSTTGFFINDLHRHPLAYYTIAPLTRLFSKSYLVKNDAPLSVLRSFVKSDWQALFHKAGIKDYTCTWQWAFRWLVTYKHPCRQ